MSVRKTFLLIVEWSTVVLLFIQPQPTLCADGPAGKVVWWGSNFTPQARHSEHTNGVIQANGEILTNILRIAAGGGHVLVLKSDNSVMGFGDSLYRASDLPVGVTNVVSIAVEGNSCWAIRRDGRVIRWGNDQDPANTVAGLRRVKSIIWAGYRSYLALREDGTVLGFRL